MQVRSPQRTRRPGAVVVCAPDPMEGHAAPPQWLLDGLLEQGSTVVTLDSAADRPLGTLTLWDLIGGMEDALAAAVAAPKIDPHRVTVLGLAGGTPLAMVAGSRPAAARVILLLPWSVEIAARRVERHGGTPRDALICTLAELQPLRTLAEAPPKPTLLLHAAVDGSGGHDHAISIAMALSLDGRPIDRLALALRSPELFGHDAPADAAGRGAVIDAVAAFASRAPE